jgi:hypothetical protein
MPTSDVAEHPDVPQPKSSAECEHKYGDTQRFMPHDVISCSWIDSTINYSPEVARP